MDMNFLTTLHTTSNNVKHFIYLVNRLYVLIGLKILFKYSIGYMQTITWSCYFIHTSIVKCNMPKHASIMLPCYFNECNKNFMTNSRTYLVKLGHEFQVTKLLAK